MDPHELGAFLRHRRERLRPADVGLVAGPRRRVAGLRRDEVAVLADMSTDYYERIEQGRGPRPSPSMLSAICRALRLSLDERDHVHLLAGYSPPDRHAALGYADPGLMCVLDAVAATVPALVCDDLHHVVAQNPLNVAMVGTLAGAGGLQSNFLWRWFTDPDVRSRYCADQHDALSREYVADLRASAARRAGDATSRRLVTELERASDEFRGIWAEQEVAVRRTSRKVLTHPRVGRLDLQCDVVLSVASGQRLVLFRAQPGTGTAERLELLRTLGSQTLEPAAVTSR
jgi:transcriptional regulator with XRE-family HTH domain